jgi:hypothetical protein
MKHNVQITKRMSLCSKQQKYTEHCTDLEETMKQQKVICSTVPGTHNSVPFIWPDLIVSANCTPICLLLASMTFDVENNRSFVQTGNKNP